MPGHRLTPAGDYARLDSLLCPWCDQILRDALQTELGIRLCQTCYKELQETPDHKSPFTGNEIEIGPDEGYHPDNAVRKEVNRLVVKCANHNQGCNWSGPLKNHEDEHRHRCDYHIVQCQNPGCGKKVLKSELEDHNLRTCQYRHVNCKYCGEDLLAKEEKTHEEKCSQAPKECSKCKTKLLREELYKHERLECRSGRICACCGKEVSVHDIETHVKEPESVFEHFQELGVKIYHVDKSMKEEMEKALKDTNLSIKENHDKISSLHESLPEVLKMKALFTSLRALANGAGLLAYLNRLERRVDGIEAKAQKQDQIIANLAGTSTSVAVSSNMEEYSPGDRLERKVEEVERQTAMLKVHMSELELQLQASLASTYNGSFLWRIPEVKKRKRDAMEGRITSIYSPPFYTGRNGYKMCIRAYLNGDGIGYNTHLSIFFVLMKGEYDPLLKWPFDYKVSLIMVDQEHQRHIVQTFKPSPSSGSFQQPKSDMNIASGCPKFAELKVLENENYVKEDILYIKCIVDVARIFHP